MSDESTVETPETVEPVVAPPVVETPPAPVAVEPAAPTNAKLKALVSQIRVNAVSSELLNELHAAVSELG